MSVTFATPQHKDGLLLQVTRSFFSRHQYCSSAVADNATVQQVEWISDHARVEHALNRYGLMVHSQRIEPGMASCDDRDLSQLFRSGAILIHVTTRRHGICSNQRIAIGRLERGFWDNCRTSARAYHSSTARKLVTGVGDQRYFTLARADCRYGVVEVRLERGSTNRRGISIPWKHL